MSDDTLADLIISGCTAVIESGKLTGKDLANIFNNRGNAYAAMKREFDRAIADYDQAIQLAPNLSGPYLNRAQTKSKKGACSCLEGPSIINCRCRTAQHDQNVARTHKKVFRT